MEEWGYLLRIRNNVLDRPEGRNLVTKDYGNLLILPISVLKSAEVGLDEPHVPIRYRLTLCVFHNVQSGAKRFRIPGLVVMFADD
jgi:hypothetical protein